MEKRTRGRSKAGREKNRRLTIGFFTESLGGVEEQYLGDVAAGVFAVAEERDVNLLCFVGGTLRHSPYDQFSYQRNVLYEMVTSDSVDGLVILGSVGTFVTAEQLASLHNRYRPLPTVSIGTPLPGIPSLIADNDVGLREAITHLILMHNRRRIAFICGPEGVPEAQMRYRVYTEVLAAHGLPLDPALVVPGDFRTPSGVAAVHLLLDQRQVDFDAIVAANDNMALGAMGELQKRGIPVPYQVAIVGFDDVESGKVAVPSLTTVRQPISELGRSAVDVLLAQIAGEKVAELVPLPTELVVRQSCGCASQAILRAWVDEATAPDEPFKAAFTARRERMLSEMVEAADAGLGDEVADWVEQLLDAFSAELRGEMAGIFLPTLDEALHWVVLAGGDVTLWHGVISAMRRHLLPLLAGSALAPRAENLWHQARVLVGEAARRVQVTQRLQIEQRNDVLARINGTLMTTFDVAELMGVTAHGISWLGLPGAYIALYEDPQNPTAGARLILACHEQERVELEEGGRRLLPRQWIPDDLWPTSRYTMVVEALYFREHPLGFALFEMGPREGTVYEILRGGISSALRGALLLLEQKRAEAALERAYAEVEQQVRERTAALEREMAERERAQEENLRLQQEVIEAQQRAIRELSAPIIPVLEGVIVMPLIGSIDTLRARDVTRALLAGIREHRAKVVILDITGVPIVDSGVAAYLNKTIQAARLKGARTIVTGVSEAVAETIVDLGIDWSGIETLSDLRTGLRAALQGAEWRVGGGA